MKKHIYKRVILFALILIALVLFFPKKIKADIPVPIPIPLLILEEKPVPVVVPKNKVVSSSCELLRGEFSKYDWDVDIALAVSKKESGCNPANHNHKDVHRNRSKVIICLGSWNVLNVGCVHYKNGEDIDDMTLNIKKAYFIYKDKRSFSAWTTCKLVPNCK